jgi:serine/threonine protein kinase
MAPPALVGGRYRVHRQIGKGALGEVYSGVDLSDGVPVAIKLLRPELAFDDDLAARLAEEARAAQRVQHPNVVDVLDAGEDDGRPWLVMELLPGWTLADELRRGPLDSASALVLARAVLSGLSAIHAAGIVHRDIKPHNILGDPGGTWKVGDFGIAKGAWSATELTSHGIVLGTLAYLAPERLEGLPATAESDLWSFGVVLFESVAGRRPYPSDSLGALARAIHGSGPLDLEAVAPGAPRNLASLVERCLDPDPAGRPSSARSALALLDASADQRPSERVAETATMYLEPAPATTAAEATDRTVVLTSTAGPAEPPFPSRPVEDQPLTLPGPQAITWLVRALVVTGLVLAAALALAASDAARGSAALAQPSARLALVQRATTERAWASDSSSSIGTAPKSSGRTRAAAGGSGTTSISTPVSSA